MTEFSMVDLNDGITAIAFRWYSRTLWALKSDFVSFQFENGLVVIIFVREPCIGLTGKSAQKTSPAQDL